MGMEHVKVYRFSEAPDEYRKYSPFGGDEDYIIVGKDEILVDMVAGRLMVCDMTTVDLGFGWVLAVTCHA